MKNYSIENLTEEQLRLVIESLLFSASTSVNARWYSEEDESIMSMALDLRKKYPEVLMKNVFVLEEKEYHDEFSDKVVNYFPEIVENTPITL